MQVYVVQALEKSVDDGLGRHAIDELATSLQGFVDGAHYTQKNSYLSGWEAIFQTDVVPHRLDSLFLFCN